MVGMWLMIKTQKKHIISRNQGVYFFDPEEKTMEEIFSF